MVYFVVCSKYIERCSCQTVDFTNVRHYGLKFDVFMRKSFEYDIVSYLLRFINSVFFIFFSCP